MNRVEVHHEQQSPLTLTPGANAMIACIRLRFVADLGAARFHLSGNKAPEFVDSRF